MPKSFVAGYFVISYLTARYLTVLVTQVTTAISTIFSILNILCFVFGVWGSNIIITAFKKFVTWPRYKVLRSYLNDYFLIVLIIVCFTAQSQRSYAVHRFNENAKFYYFHSYGHR